MSRSFLRAPCVSDAQYLGEKDDVEENLCLQNLCLIVTLDTAMPVLIPGSIRTLCDIRGWEFSLGFGNETHHSDNLSIELLDADGRYGPKP